MGFAALLQIAKSGSEQALSTLDGPYTPTLEGGNGMSKYRRAPGAKPRSENRKKLKAIIERLGQEATAYEIREAAKAEAFSFHSSLLSILRDEVFPARRKRPSQSNLNFTTMPMTGQIAACPCSSTRVRNYGIQYLPDGTAKRYYKCQDCGAKTTAIGEVARQINPRRAMAIKATEKVCSSCRLTLPVEAFGKKAGDAHLYRSSCKKCLNVKRAEHYFRTRDRVRFPNGHPKAIHRRETIPSISPQEYEAMGNAQGWKCAICDTTDKGVRIRYWCVDHCHKTGQIRGLLCNKCNLGLGNFNDDVERLEMAVRYLRKALNLQLRKEGSLHG